jgi:putative membrane-bound dehydrogenase-like protein
MRFSNRLPRPCDMPQTQAPFLSLLLSRWSTAQTHLSRRQWGYSRRAAVLYLGWLMAWTLAPASLPAQTTSKQTQAAIDKTASNVQLLQPGIQLTMLAEHPQLATPTGIDVDAQGNIWLVACHTHFRPNNYTGPVHDEILVFDREGKSRRVFYNKTKTTMQLLLSQDGWVYLAQRDRIVRVQDSNGDGIGDVEETIVSLDTVADYPHNGLSGMAWHTDGRLVFSLGENFGKDWTLRGRDGSSLQGKGEGGVFYATRDGSQLQRIARGFWNPFGLMMRSDGNLFAAENDPGSRPPCRLLHVVEGADYGFNYIYGSAPVHPFVAWNGELRGTLGMIHPCSEGPCSVVELGGGLMIPSWSNHCIDFFPLHWAGATLTSERIELLHGSDFFRPVCMVRAPDGAYYFTDWVSPSYELHGLGRLWKMEIDSTVATWMQPAREPATAAADQAQGLRSGTLQLPIESLLRLAKGSDRGLADAALTAMAISSQAWTLQTLIEMKPEDRVWALVSLRRVDLQDPKWVRGLWDQSDAELQFELLRWIADADFKEFLPKIEAKLKEPALEYRWFEAALAAQNTLKGNPNAGVTDATSLIQKILDPAVQPAIRAYALRLAPPQHEALTVDRLMQWYQSNNAALSTEAVWTLVMQRSPTAQRALTTIAADPKADDTLRAVALVGLLQVDHPEVRHAIESTLEASSFAIRKEALRALRHPTLAVENKQALLRIKQSQPELTALVDAVLDPSSTAQRLPESTPIEAWMERLQALPGTADAEAGRRVFFSAGSAACSQCHRFEGRGNVVGPDLSLIHRQGTPLEILRSIVEPNGDVAPQYYTTLLELHDGSTFSGILLRSSSNEVYRNSQGDEVTFQKADIENRKELKSSLMPTGLAAQLTDVELRDLLAFLTAERTTSTQPAP